MVQTSGFQEGMFCSTLLHNPLGPIAPKGARLTLCSFVPSHFTMPFTRELILLLVVGWFSQIVVIKVGKGAERRSKQLFWQRQVF